jgi:hypothetical protein
VNLNIVLTRDGIYRALYECIEQFFDSLETEVSVNNLISQQVQAFERDLRLIESDSTWVVCKNVNTLSRGTWD